MSSCLEPHTTFNLQQAANFLQIHKETVRQWAAAGRIPGAKLGRCWVFLKHDLVNYLRAQYSGGASQGVNNRSKTIWHSTSEKQSIGLISPITEREYNEQLGLATK